MTRYYIPTSGVVCIAPIFKAITVKLLMVEDSLRAPVCPLPRDVATMSQSHGGKEPEGSKSSGPGTAGKRSKEKDRKREQTRPDSQEEATKCFLLNNLKLVLLMAH